MARYDNRASAHERGYDAQWRKARKAFLTANPLCCMCLRDGRTEAASVVDHITPHRGDKGLFWDRCNWQSLCQPHHDSTKQAIERRGFVFGADASGRPIDPEHPWNAR